MKFNKLPHHKSTGFGLIEALIATVVVAIGLLAVAALQSGLISSSRSNKVRAEAKALADTKIEQLRDTIEQSNTTSGTGYDQLVVSGADASPIVGVSESFTRVWTVTDLTGPARKQIGVSVCWADGCPVSNTSSNQENQVFVQSIITFDAVGNSGLLAKGVGSAGIPISGPSLNVESSDEISETIDLSTPATPGSVVTVNSQTYIVKSSGTKGIKADLCSSFGVNNFENGLKTRRVNHDGVTGNEAIELYESVIVSSIEYCIPRMRYNGGVIVPIRGIVHSGATTGHGGSTTLLDVNLFTFNASETGAFCYFKPSNNTKSAPYVCYVGGNCTGFTGTTDDTDVTKCPNNSYAAAIVGPGGWRGKVGLLGIAGPSSSFFNVCFGEEITGTPATLDTGRNYFSRNTIGGANVNQGINKPYSCHDFLIINGQSTNAQVHNECVTQANAIGGFTLASKTIQRNISGANLFDPTVDTSFCTNTGTNYTITGTITNANAAPTVTVTDATITNNCTSTATSYNCQISTTATSVTISGYYNSETVTCTLTPPTTSGCGLSFTPSSNPTYTVAGTISGSAASRNAVTLTMSGGGVCTNNMNGTYSCTITTASSTATLTATIASGGTVSPSTAQTIALSGTAPITGTAFAASGLYTISGNISITLDNNQSPPLSTVTAAVVTNTGSCTLTGTHAHNTIDSYSCTVISGNNQLTISMSPACSTGNNSRKFEMSDGTTTSLGTGFLVIPFTNITSDITKNITIAKSNTSC